MGRKLPLAGRKPKSVKPEKARKLIRKFHVLLKSQAAAEAAGRAGEAAKISEEINALGGLETYQRASICGQSGLRGGDSSKLLVQWLRSKFPTDQKRSLLEVGCLQVDNACARSKLFDPHTRIDLNSQHPQILQQDFMSMELREPYDVLSLSLVVNYVPDAATRGQMLIRAHSFLNPDGLLFFVLPRACTDNSRYCDHGVMADLFAKVGFKVVAEHKTAKLVYWLLQKLNVKHKGRMSLAKRKVRDGASMNNFAIVIE